MRSEEVYVVFRCAVIVVVTVAAIFAEAGAPARAASDGLDASTSGSSVERASAAFHQALRTNDANTLFSYVADDVVLMPPGEAAVRGKAAMRDWYTRFLAAYHTSSLSLTEREVFTGDGWAVELGAYEWVLRPTAGGEPIIDRGHYMQVWKLQPDGQWRFGREIWNSLEPPSAPTGK